MTVHNVVSFVIPGPPQGKGRARATRTGRMYTPARTVAYESLVALAGQAAMAGAQPWSGPVALDLVAVHPIPASWSRKRRQEAETGLRKPMGKPDLDNVAKAIADGLNGIVWRDDAQIVRLTIGRQYGSTPAVHVVAAALGAPTPEAGP